MWAAVTVLGSAVPAPLAAAAVAGQPLTVDDTAQAAVERAAFVALPATYELRAAIRVVALVAGRRRLPIGRDLEFRGSAFGVAPGRVATARHLVVPSARTLATAAIETFRPPGLDASTPGLRVVARPVAVTLTRARTEATALEIPRRPVPIAATLLGSDRAGDVALLSTPDVHAPALALFDDVRSGVRVALVGFGAGARAVPAVRAATLDGLRRTARTGDRRYGGLREDVVRPGDSGGPVVDDQGRARGIVLRAQTGRASAVVGRTQTIRDLLDSHPDPAAPAPNETTREFRQAMELFWRRDYPRAATRLAELEARYRDAALVTYERTRAERLAGATYTVDGPARARAALLAFAATALIVAVVLGALRVSLPRRRPRTYEVRGPGQ